MFSQKRQSTHGLALCPHLHPPSHIAQIISDSMQNADTPRQSVPFVMYFYSKCSEGKGEEDNIELLLAVQGVKAKSSWDFGQGVWFILQKVSAWDIEIDLSIWSRSNSDFSL